MALFPFLIWALTKDVIMFWDKRQPYMQACSLVAYACAWLTFLLNAFWYTLIVKKLLRIFESIGLISKSEEKARTEKKQI